MSISSEQFVGTSPAHSSPAPAEPLFERYHQLVYAFCYHVLQDAETAFVASASTWSQVAEAPAVQGGNSVIQLLRAAASACETVLARAGDEDMRLFHEPQTLRGVDWDSAHIADLAASPTTDVVLRNSMEALSPRQRVVVVLKYHYGASYREISDIVQQPQDEVRWDLRSGLLAVSFYLQAERGR